MAEPLSLLQTSHAEGENKAESQQLLERYKKQMAHTWDAEIEQQIHGIATGGEGSTQERCASYKHEEAMRTLENKRLLVPVIVSRRRERAAVRGPIAASEQRLGKAVAMRETLLASPSHKAPEGTAGRGVYMYGANTALVSVAFPISPHRGVLEEDVAPTSAAMARESSSGDDTCTAHSYFRSQRARAEADLRGSYASPIAPLPLPQPVTFSEPKTHRKLPRRRDEANVGTVDDETTANDAHRADSLSPFFRHTPVSIFAPSSVTFQQKRLEKQTQYLLLADEERGRLRDRANGIVRDVVATETYSALSAVTKDMARGEHGGGVKELHSLLAARDTKKHQNTVSKEQQRTVGAPHLRSKQQHLPTRSTNNRREDKLVVSADVYDALAAIPLPTRYEDMIGVAATALESNLYLSFADKERQDAEHALLKRQGEVEQSFKRGWMSFVQRSRAELRPDTAAIASLFIGFRVALAEIHAHFEHERAKAEHATQMQLPKRRESNISSSTASPTRGRECEEQHGEVLGRPSLSVLSRSPFTGQTDATHTNDKGETSVLLNTSLFAGLAKSEKEKENENEDEREAWGGSSQPAFGDFAVCKDPVERCRTCFEANDWLLRRDGYLWLSKKEGSSPSSILWVKQQTFSTPLSFYAILSAVCPKSTALIGESLAGLITGSTAASSLPLEPLPMGIAALKASTTAVLSDSEGGGGDRLGCRTAVKRSTLSVPEADAEEKVSAGKQTPVSAALSPVSGSAAPTHVRETNLKTSPSKKGLFHRSVSRLQGALHVASHSPIVALLRLDESQLSDAGQEGSSPPQSSSPIVSGGPFSSQTPSPAASSLGLPRLGSSPFKSFALSRMQTKAKLGLRRSIRQPSEFVASTTAAEGIKRKNNLSLGPLVVPSDSEERTNAHQAHRFLPPLRSSPGGLANSLIASKATNATPPPQPPLASGLGAILAQGSLQADGPLLPPPVDLLALFEQFSDTKSSFIQKFGPPSQQSLNDSVPLSGVSRRRSSRRLTLSYNGGRLNNGSFERNTLDGRLSSLPSGPSPTSNLLRGSKNRGSVSTTICRAGGDAFTPVRATLRERSKGASHTLLVSNDESRATGAGAALHVYLESTMNRSFAFSDKSGTVVPSDSHALTARSLLSSATGADREKEKERGANMMSGAGLILMSLSPNFADEEEGMSRIDALFERNSRVIHPCTLPKALEAYFTVLFPRLASFRPQSDKLPGLVKAYDADKDGVLSASEFASMIMKERFFRYKMK